MILKRNHRDGDLDAVLVDLVRAAHAQGTGFLLTMIAYIPAEPNHVGRSLVGRALRQAIPEQEERIMSIASEEWIAEGKAIGRAIGRTEGKAEGKAETLVRLLERRFGPLPESLRGKVMATDRETLDAWLDRILGAPSPEAVFGGPAAH